MICPLRIINYVPENLEDTEIQCFEEKCAWWCTIDKKKLPDVGECAIPMLTAMPLIKELYAKKIRQLA